MTNLLDSEWYSTREDSKDDRREEWIERKCDFILFGSIEWIGDWGRERMEWMKRSKIISDSSITPNLRSITSHNRLNSGHRIFSSELTSQCVSTVFSLQTGASHSTTFANVALLRTAVVHSGYLDSLRSFLPSDLIESCPLASLSTLVSSLSLSPPSILASHSVDQHYNLTHITNGLHLISKRFPLGIPLVSNSVIFH